MCSSRSPGGAIAFCDQTNATINGVSHHDQTGLGSHRERKLLTALRLLQIRKTAGHSW